MYLSIVHVAQLQLKPANKRRYADPPCSRDFSFACYQRQPGPSRGLKRDQRIAVIFLLL